MFWLIDIFIFLQTAIIFDVLCLFYLQQFETQNLVNVVCNW